MLQPSVDRGTMGAGNATSKSLSLELSVRRRLRRDILTGAAAPNGKLRVMELASRYGVAGTTVREALASLVPQGLVISEANRGFRAAPISTDDLFDLTRSRQIIDGEAFRLAIERGDDAWEGEIVGLYHRLSRIRPDPKNPFEWEALHRRFHHALISACGLVNLLQISDRLYDLGARYRFVMLHITNWTRDIATEHRALMEFALARDAEKGVALLRTHLELTMRALTAEMGNGARGN